MIKPMIFNAPLTLSFLYSTIAAIEKLEDINPAVLAQIVAYGALLALLFLVAMARLLNTRVKEKAVKVTAQEVEYEKAMTETQKDRRMLSRLDQLELQVAGLQSDVTDKNREIGNLKDQVYLLQSNVTTLTEDKTNQQAQIEGMQARILILENDNKALNEQLAEKNRQLIRMEQAKIEETTALAIERDKARAEFQGAIKLAEAFAVASQLKGKADDKENVSDPNVGHDTGAGGLASASTGANSEATSPG